MVPGPARPGQEKAEARPQIPCLIPGGTLRPRRIDIRTDKEGETLKEIYESPVVEIVEIDGGVDVIFASGVEAEGV